MKEEDANNHPNPRPVEEEVAEWSYHDFGDHRIYGLSLFSILATVHSTCARMIVCADHKFENFLVCRSVYDSVSFILAKDQFHCELHWPRQRNQTPSVSGAHDT